MRLRWMPILLALLVTIVNIPMSFAPTQVYSLDEIMLKKFEKTGWTIQPASPFYLPDQGQAQSAVILQIEGQSYGDQYSGGTPISRYLQVYINSQKIWSDNSGNGKIVTGSFTFSVDITSKVQWWNENTPVMNTAGVYLTTYVGYWIVRAYVYVVYNANSNFRVANSQFANWYKFQNTGWNVINFAAQLPESIVSQANGAVITLHAKSYGDKYLRVLDLYIDGQKVNHWTVYGQTDPNNPPTFDATSYLLGKHSVTIGVVLTTYEGYWIVDGDIKITYRPGVAPDTSKYWKGEEHSLTQRAGNLIADSVVQNTLVGLYSFDTKTKEDPVWKSVYTGLTVKIPDAVAYGIMIRYAEFTIKAKHQYQGYLTADRFVNKERYTGSSGGTSKAGDIGSDLLAIMSAGLSCIAPTQPELAAVAAVASVLIKYASTTEYSETNLNDGIRLSWTNWSNVRQKSILYKYDINWPYLGQYTVEITTKLEIYYCSPNLNYYYVGSVSFMNSYLFYN